MAAKGPPRFVAPIAADKIRSAPVPPTEAVLLETITTSAPEGMPSVSVGRITSRPITTARAPRTTGAPEESGVDAVELLGARVTKRSGLGATGIAAPTGDVGDLPLTLAELEDRLTTKMNEPKTAVNPDIYVPSSRRAFKHFIIQAYWRYKLPEVPNVLDPDACAKQAEASKKELKAFQYQAFVRDYIQKPSPYRGVLLYHGLGSGKTCTSIISFEALYQMGQQPVYIMTPASLSPNYKDDIINKCGPFIYRANNFWTWVSVPSLSAATPESEMLIRRIGIPVASVRKRKGAWVPDPSKANAPNFDTLAPEHRRQVQEQIYEHLTARLKFVHYNGLTEAQIRDWACNTPHKFDGATVVIDEVHNLVRTINNSGLENFYKDESRDMPQYTPKFCGVGKKYRISYLLYRMLCNAVGCKIIALSATPIINFPQEVAVLANLLAGDTRMVEVNISGLDRTAEILRILEKHAEVDFAEVLPRADITASTIRITPVPSGYRKVIEPATGAFRGFIQDTALSAAAGERERERDLPAWFERIATALAPLTLSFQKPTFRCVSRLPDVEKTFKDMFIDTERLEVKERLRLPLMARLSGLVSYYKGGKADLMASVPRDEIVMVDMSELQLGKYTEQRKSEIDKELREKKKPKKATSMYELVNKTQNSTFKIFSRAACNFVFPDDMERPIPSDYHDQLDMVGKKEPLMAEEKDEAPAEEEDAEEEAVITDAVAEGDDNGAAPPAPPPTEGAAPPAEVGKNPYKTALLEAVRILKTRAGELFSKENLPTLSPKFQAIIDRLITSRGPALVYSNFKTLEGVGLFGVALEAQLGFRKLDIVPSGGSWTLSPETLTSSAATPRYITYTGDEDRAKRNILLAIFNGKWGKIPPALAAQIKDFTGTDNNQSGGIARVFMITQSGAEGISLANVRQVHIMEPYWNYVRLEQVKGRAIRICSHMDLPPAERTVEVFTYVTKFSEKQIKERRVDETLINFDDGQTTDENILEICNGKKKLADSIMNTMKSAAVDCELNTTENGGYACYRFADKASMESLFHPIVENHIREAEASVRSTAAAAGAGAP